MNLNDWYHFFWDRTRSIRKDLTQQGLCCTGSVKLVEQCARFHIHCAARLASEDVSVFDQRINTENLTKCLQSLKYMYHDLGKRGEICENEAEFRAYIILLNLNNCNFMWEVQRWSPAIQQSPQVQFAIKVFLAVDSNNYVKFFKLVRETTYLNACVLLRYFNQVRAKAITTIVKSFVARIPTTFSLTDMTNILAFEDIEQCIHFVENYGLSCNITEDIIYLDKQMFAEPEFSLQSNRCLNIIESKRSCTVGEAIYGGPLPEMDFSRYVPHNSFDEEGYLTSEALSASDQTLTNDETTICSPSPTFESTIFKKINPAPDVEKPSSSDSSLVDKSNNIFGMSSFAQPKTNNNVELSTNLLQIPINNNLSKTIITSASNSSQSTNIFKTASTTSSNIFTDTSNLNIFASSGTNIFSKQPDNTQSNVSNTIFSQTVSNQNNHSLKIDVPGEKSVFAGSTTGSSISNSPFSFATSSNNNNVTSHTSTPQNNTNNNHNFTFGLVKQPEIQPEAIFSQQKNLEQQTSKETENKYIDVENKKLIDLNKLEEEKEKQKQIAVENCIKEASKLFDEILTEEISQTCKSQALKELQRFNKICSSAIELTDQFITDIIKTVLHEEVLLELRVHRSLQSLQTKNQQRIAKKYFNLWLENVLIIKLKRKAIEETPIWIPARSVDEEASLLYRENQKSALENILNYKNFSVDSIFVEHETVKKINQLRELCENIITSSQNLKPKSKAYWKVIISIPDEIEGSYWSKYLDNWVDRAFRETDDSKDKNQLHLNEYFDRNYATSVAISYRKNIGCCNNIEDLLGMNSMIFFTMSDSFSQTRMKERLMKVLKHRDRPTFSFIIICVKAKHDANCDVKEFDSFLRDNGFSDRYCILISEDHKFNTLHSLSTEALEWLSKLRIPDSHLQMDSFESFIYDCLGSELIQKLAFASRNNYVLRKLFLDPNFIIQLYNNAVGKCLEMISDESLHEYKDFAPELRRFLPEPLSTTLTYEYFPENWRNVKHLCRIRSVIKNFEMPYFDDTSYIQDATEFNTFLIKHCAKILPGSEQVEALASKMFCVAFKNVNHSPDFQTQMKNMCWTDIIDVLVRDLVTEKLNRILSKDPSLFIVYNTKLFLNYLNEPWWLKCKQFILQNRADQEKFEVIEKDYEYDNKRKKLNSNISTIDEIGDSISRALKTLDRFDRVFDKSRRTAKKELINKYERLNLTLQEQESKIRALNNYLDTNAKKFLNDFS